MARNKGGAWDVAVKTAPAIFEGDTNIVYSPACIFEGLRIVRMGADGATACEIDGLLGVEGVEGDWLGLDRAEGWACEDYEAHLASGIWLDGKAEPSDAFIERCRAGEIPIVEADLAAPNAGEQITRWIADKTEGSLAPAVDLDPDALACVASALYFKDAWANVFPKRMTRRDSFHAGDGDVDSDFMVTEADMPVVDADFGEIVGCPLSNGASMVFVLPNEGVALRDLIVDGSLLEAVRDFDSKSIYVELHVPKFECETTVEDVSAALVRAGFGTALAPDLSPMVGRAEVPASYVHGARITIDEDGIEGSAYFAVVACAGAPLEESEVPEPRAIVLDRPFAYVVVSRTGQPLFVGTVCSPEADPHAWLPFASEGEEGSEGGWIVEDEEIPGVCRITLEEGGAVPYAIACSVYGLMLHTVFADDYDNAMGKFEGMKRDLKDYAYLSGDASFDVSAWCESFVGIWA